MAPKRNWAMMLPLAVLLALLFTALAPHASVAYAQDGEPPPPPTEEVSSDEGEDAAGDTDADTPEPAPTEEPPAPSDDPGGDVEPAAEETEAGETDTPEAEATEVEAADAEAPEAEPEPSEPPPGVLADPYFFIGGTAYNFTTIQAAIDYLSSNDATPDANTVYVEDGNFVENPNIDGSSWTTTPTELILQSENGSGSTTITGSLTIQNMFDFILRGFTTTEGVTADGNTGTLTLEDVIASGTGGDGIVVSNQDGEVVLQDVHADNNAGVGAFVDNTAGGDGVTITDSTFNDNNTVAATGQQGGLQVFSDGTVVLDGVEASGNTDGDGAWVEADGVSVTDSTFNDNSSPLPDWGYGLYAASYGGPIFLQGVTANNNDESGAFLGFYSADPGNSIYVGFSQFNNNAGFGVWAMPETGTVTFRCLKLGGNALGPTMVPVGETVLHQGCPPPYKEKSHEEYVGVKLSTEEEKIVNAGNGVLITFPPIVIIDEETMARAKVFPLKEKELPADLLPDDLFLAGVNIELINAELPEDPEDPDAGLIKLEFYIPAYRMEDNFAVLWWDAELEEWVELDFTIEPHDRVVGGKVVVEWPEAGIFVLVERGVAGGD